MLKDTRGSETPPRSTLSRASGAGLDLGKIAASLRELQRRWPLLNPELKVRRENLDDETVENLVSGYAYVSLLLERRAELFAYGGSSHFLELNNRVLCGTSPQKRREYQDHIAATHRHFYDRTNAGIQALTEWYALHQQEPLWRRAAGLHLQIVSEPQLFIEGNDRTSALVISYLFAREGHPPFVLDPWNAKRFLDLSAEIKQVPLNSLSGLIRNPRLKAQMAVFLQQQVQGHSSARGI